MDRLAGWYASALSPTQPPWMKLAVVAGILVVNAVFWIGVAVVLKFVVDNWQAFVPTD